MPDVPLRKFVERLFVEHEKAHAAQHHELDRRLDTLNRVQEQARDDRGRFLTREAYEASHKALAERTEGLASELRERTDGLARDLEVRRTLAMTVYEERMNIVSTRINDLERFRAKALVLAPILVIVGGILGAAIEKLLLG
jgi:hypothetical protein